MLSRWTDIFTTDGEKEWRNRDTEFENDFHTKTNLLNSGEKAGMFSKRPWNRLLSKI